MKILLLLAASLCLSVPAFGQYVTKVEKLTPAEMKALEVAQAKVSQARAEQEALLLKIAQDHGMKEESWMEWQTYTEISGEYILLRFHNSMIKYPIPKQ